MSWPLIKCESAGTNRGKTEDKIAGIRWVWTVTVRIRLTVVIRSSTAAIPHAHPVCVCSSFTVRRGDLVVNILSGIVSAKTKVRRKITDEFGN